MIRRASRMAWEAINAKGTLKGQRWQVYDWLYHNGPATSGEVTYALRKDRQPHANYHVRLSELLELGVVSRGTERKCNVTGSMVSTWDVTDLLPRKPSETVNALRERGAELNRRAEVLRQKAHVLLLRAIELESDPLPHVDEPARPW